MLERLTLVIVVACALVTLVAVRNGALDTVAGIVLVGALLLFVRAAFRLVDEVERRHEERGRRGRDG